MTRQGLVPLLLVALASGAAAQPPEVFDPPTNPPVQTTVTWNSISFLVGNDKFYLELNQEIDVDAERAKLQKELEYHQGFKQSVEKKLGNERFVNNAPAAVVDRERQKLADSTAKIERLEEALAQLN